MDEPPIPFEAGDLVVVRKSHDGPSAGRSGTVRELSPGPYERARDRHGLRMPRGLSTRLVWVLLEGEQYPNVYWPEVLELVGKGVAR
jgi:hypothetical protein